MIIAILIAAQALLILYSGYKGRRSYIMGSCIFPNMAMIVIFAPFMITILGYQTNIGSIFYAAVVAGQIFVLERWGPLSARESMPLIYLRLVAILFTCMAIQALPVVPGNETFAEAAKLVSRQQSRVVVAAFSAFALSQLALILTYPYCRRTCGPLVAAFVGMIVCQLIDSPVFYIIAFYGSPDIANTTLLSMILVGFTAKVFFGALLMPAVFLGIGLAEASDKPSSTMMKDERSWKMQRLTTR